MTGATPDQPMTNADRQSLIRIAKGRAKQAEREAEMQEKILIVEVLDLMTAEYAARDELWSDAVAIAEEAAAKANTQIQLRCAELGIPPKRAPQLHLNWSARSGEFVNRDRRGELRKLAESKAAAVTKTAKTAIQASALDIEERLVLGGLQTDEAREVIASMPTVADLMPALSLEDLGVTRWQPPEDIAAQLTTPMTPAQRRKRQILRAIEANPGASDRRIAEIANCDHKTVAAHRRERGEFPAIGGEFPTDGTQHDQHP
jgi:hypothetical protein